MSYESHSKSLLNAEMPTLPLLVGDLRFFTSSPTLPLWYINLPLFTCTTNIDMSLLDMSPAFQIFGVGIYVNVPARSQDTWSI